MLSKSDNEMLCRVGPGTAMGDLMRQYWFPAIPSFELPEADCAPIRVRLLGEDLVAFRDSEGKVGIFTQACPHRGASMFFGRNEENGLRCVYHGWKFDTTGTCVDMPSEPAESNFKNKVRIRSYPARDVNRMIWVYMGPRETPPPFPEYDIVRLPIEHVSEPRLMMEESNWFQNLEGDIDSVHIDYLHSRLYPDKMMAGGIRGFYTRDRAPDLDVVPTDYGAFYSARREWDEAGSQWHRITQFILPFHTMIAASAADTVTLRTWLPLDDHYTLQIAQQASLSRPLTDQERDAPLHIFDIAGGLLPANSDPISRYMTVANKRNDFMRDFELEKTTQFCGILFVGNLQDRAMTELMCNEDGIEPIYDRSKEHLGTTDRMVIAARRILIGAARAFREDGVLPANVDSPRVGAVRSASVILPADADWVAETETARNAYGGVKVAYVIPT
jgi:phenylpropionate dioxygenase-like ring-hydroxylating dioxygenase large terminal subunit